MPALLFTRIDIIATNLEKSHAMDVYLQLNREYYFHSFVLKRDDLALQCPIFQKTTTMIFGYI